MFSEIDTILEVAALQQGLHWVHEYRGEEVRSTEVSLSSDRFAQLWIERTETGFAVCAWDRKINRFREASSVHDLPQALSRVIAMARSWV
jgi:hypothetical protein